MISLEVFIHLIDSYVKYSLNFSKNLFFSKDQSNTGMRVKMCLTLRPQQNASHSIAKSLALLVIITQEMSERLVKSFGDEIFAFRKFGTTRKVKPFINTYLGDIEKIKIDLSHMRYRS